MSRRSLLKRRSLRALREPAFRWYILGRLAGSSTGPLRSIAQGWLVYQLTGSVLALGGVSGLRSATMMLTAPVAGVISDRFDRRKVMMAARLILTAINLGLAGLALTDNLALWHLFTAAVLEGIALAAKDPAEQAILADLVSSGTLASAISTTAVFEGLMGMLAAAAGGLLMEYVGPSSLFFALALLFVAAGLTYRHLPMSTGKASANNAMLKDIADGVRYLRTEPALLAVLAIGFARVLFIQPYQDFLPALAEDRFKFGATGLGLLTTATGAAQMISSLIIVSRGYISERQERRTVVLAGAAAGVLLVAFVSIPLFPLPFLFIFLVEGASNVARVTYQSTLQVTCDPGYRGRASSISMMLVQLARMGAVPAGAFGDRFGVVPVLVTLGLLATAAHLLMGFAWNRKAVEVKSATPEDSDGQSAS